MASSFSSSFVPLDNWTCISQGAEARLWLIPNYLPNKKSCIAKERFSKPYRHPTLDARLLKQRCKAEAKCLVKCRRAGVACPAIYGVHSPVLYLENVGEQSVRQYLQANVGGTHVVDYTQLATKMGSILAKLHNSNVVHGDLTTSNMMLSNDENEIIMIDFGLARVSTNPEEFGVDLYVLERALLSTHPELEEIKFLDNVLATYKSECKRSDANLQKLSAVRLRGRKREAFG